MLFPPPPNHSLTPGSIAGIVIAVLVIAGVATVVVIVIVMVAKRKTDKVADAEVYVNCARPQSSILYGRDSPDAAPPPGAQVQ